MIEFRSASTRMVNSTRAMAECLESALGADTDCDVLVFCASLGHDYAALAAEARRLAPSARVVGASCCGIVGREGVSESMKDVAVMAMRGRGELAVASVAELRGDTAYEGCRELARELVAQRRGIRAVMFLGSGIDTANDRCIAGFESVLGPDVTIFGATSSDNMRGVVSHQVVGGTVHEHAAWAIGFADPTLEVDTQATHGFVAIGEPMVVTRASGHRIHELDGAPAWPTFTARLGLDAAATCGETIPIGALAERLPPELAAEYGNEHLLRVVTHREPDGTMLYPTTCATGTELWLTVRDEARIFADLDRMTARMVARIGAAKPVAVFHADCLARGRYLLNRVLKEELVGRMQLPFATDGAPPPWLGMYGFGEFARLGGANTYHNYTTALYALYRRPCG